jgi:predicted cupin superfamily sugar epimerase
MQSKVAYYLEKLGLTRHVEGGSFREVYRSTDLIPHSALPKGFAAARPFGTAIYFLLEEGQFSAFHRIASDETWHFYEGDTLSIYEINTNGQLIRHQLGKDLEAGEQFQLTIPAGSWFGSRCEVKNGFSLVGCTVAPGFDFADFELASKETLKLAYPEHGKIIEELTNA